MTIRYVEENEIFPVWKADTEGPYGWKLDLSDERWADYDRVQREYNAWQQFIERRVDMLKDDNAPRYHGAKK